MLGEKRTESELSGLDVLDGTLRALTEAGEFVWDGEIKGCFDEGRFSMALSI